MRHEFPVRADIETGAQRRGSAAGGVRLVTWTVPARSRSHVLPRQWRGRLQRRVHHVDAAGHDELRCRGIDVSIRCATLSGVV